MPRLKDPKLLNKFMTTQVAVFLRLTPHPLLHCSDTQTQHGLN